MDDPVTRVLAQIDHDLELLAVRQQTLTEVRELLRRILGENQPDGWAQIGHRGDE